MLMNPWVIVLLALAYVLVLFAIAYFADNSPNASKLYRITPCIYPLTLAVYCTSWTFFGAVGTAAKSGWDYLPIYLGPMLVMIFGYDLLKRMIDISKAHRITSIADFIAFRYGRDRMLALLVTIASVIGSIPYIALQLKAITAGFVTITEHHGVEQVLPPGITALILTLVLALFSILFGARNLDASEHHRGMMWAIAFESLIKLLAFIAIGLFVMFQVMDGPGHFVDLMKLDMQYNQRFTGWNLDTGFLVNTLIAITAMICLPRQFHVAVVENKSIADLRRARWAFPLYLLIFSFLVLPISMGGLLLFSGQQVNPDSYVLAIPLAQNNELMTLIAFIGGFSAATGMVIVATVALATMISNDLVMPLLLRSRGLVNRSQHDISRILMMVRRISIPSIALVAYIYYLQIERNESLAAIGLLSFSAVANFAPPLIIGMYWNRVGRLAARAGLAVGFSTWFIVLFLPSMVDTQQPLHEIARLPLWQELQHTLAYSEFSTRVGISLLLNSLTILVFTLLNLNTHETRELSTSKPTEPPQSDKGLIKVDELKSVISQFIGKQRAHSAYASYLGHDDHRHENQLATPALIQFTERLLAGSIGTASARTVLTVALQRQGLGAEDAMQLLNQTSRAVRFNRHIMETTLNNISEAVCVVDENMQLIGWNVRFEQLFQFPDGLPYQGQPVIELLRFSAENGYMGQSHLQQRLNQRIQQMRNGEHYRQTRNWPDGRVIEIQGVAIPNGGFLTTFTDITVYKRTEQALRESEQSVRLYTDNAPAMLIYIDSDMVIRFANRAYADFYGKPMQQVINHKISHLLGSEEYQRCLPQILNALNGTRQEYEDEFPRYDNELIYLLITYIPDIDEYHQVRGFFGVLQDISQRRKAELAVEEANIMLEQRVFERTHELEQINTQLITAREQAEAANQSKTRFLAAASHDLLQPMNAARLFVSVMQQQRDSLLDTQRELLNRIDNSLDAAEELLTGLLDISKLDSGYTQPKISVVSIESIFEKLIYQFAPLCEEKDIELRVRCHDHWVRSDQQLLQRIIQNLLANAIRYTSQGGILLSCRQRGGNIEIGVWDTGVGIAKQDQSMIFAEFHRLDDGKRMAEKGLGLGLAISERMARVLGHQLGVNSEPGRGSHFWLRVEKAEPEPKPGGKPDDELTSSQNPLQDLNVLCIDNEVEILHGMEALLRGWGCRVYTATDHLDARGQLDQDSNVDFILADYHLAPDKNGVDLVAELQQRYGSHLQAIIITADRSPELESRVAELRFGLLQKPIKPAALRSLMRNMLRKAISHE